MDLINKAKAGYQGAYEALFNYYYLYIYNYINGIVKNYTDAEDLTMVTFEKAFKDLNKYAPFFTFKTWLSRIARNTALDFIRMKRFTFVDITKISYLKSNIENPEQKIINQEKLAILKYKINNLTEKRRNTVIMRTMGLKCREIADETGVGINTILGQISHIKQKLVS
jgi:RNA polymerase sigma-70 factor (ECF subfamily)